MSFLKPVDTVDRFFIDGPMDVKDLQMLIPDPPRSISTHSRRKYYFLSPDNPHSGCFVLTKDQLQYWSDQSWFLDGDCSFISPLESAATLGLLKTFTLYKPHISCASFLELQHWGVNFRNLIGGQIHYLKSAS